MTDIKKHIQSIHKKISEFKSLNEKINTIASYTKIITGARRCSLFIFQKKNAQLKSIYNDGLKESIILKSNIGLVGYAFHKKETVLENDVSKNPIFFNSVDKQFDFTTRNILAVPIIDKDNNCLGAIQLLNKKIGFNQDDQNHVETLIPLIASLLIPETSLPNEEAPNPSSRLELLQKRLSVYMQDKRLFLMGDGYAYYKILNMKRIYFIGADSCHQLSENPSIIEIYYYTNDDEFLSIEVSAKFDNAQGKVLISENKSKEDFIYYPIERDV